MRRVVGHRPVGTIGIARTRRSREIVVRSLAASRTSGLLQVGNITVPCALGRSGCGVRKREGDGVTPVGSWPMRCVFYRADRIARPLTNRPVFRVRGDDGWCDAPRDKNYNRFVRHPYAASAEHIWRGDGLYDVVFVLGHNDRPRIQGAGSAIFMHLSTEGLTPTEGCVAIARADYMRLRHVFATADSVRIVGGPVQLSRRKKV